MRMTFFVLGISLIFTVQAESQTIPIIWSASFEIEKSVGAAKKEHAFTFESYTLPQTTPMRFLEMRPTAGTKNVNAKVYVNGIKVHNSEVNPSLIPIALLEQNHVHFSLEGRPGEGIQARVLALDELAPLFGPLKIESNRKQKAQKIRIPTPGAGEYVFWFQTDGRASVKDVLRSVKVNDIVVIGKHDLNDGKSLFVVATLQDVNDLVLETKGKEGISLTVLRDPLAELPSRGRLSFNLSEEQLHSIGTNLRVNVEGAEFSQQKREVDIYRNGERLPLQAFDLYANEILIPKALINGLNTFEIVAMDKDGKSLYLAGNFSAGGRRFSVTLIDELTGKALQNGHAALAFENSDAVIAGNANQGIVSFEGIPDGPVVIRAESGEMRGFQRFVIDDDDYRINVPLIAAGNFLEFESPPSSMASISRTMFSLSNIGFSAFGTYPVSKINTTPTLYSSPLWKKDVLIGEQLYMYNRFAQKISLPPGTASLRINVSGRNVSTGWAVIATHFDNVYQTRTLSEGPQEFSVPISPTTTEVEVIGVSTNNLPNPTTSIVVNSISFFSGGISQVRLTDTINQPIDFLSTDPDNTAPNLAGETFLNGRIDIVRGLQEKINDVELHIFKESSPSVPAAICRLGVLAKADLDRQNAGVGDITLVGSGTTSGTSLFVIPASQAANIYPITNQTRVRFKVVAISNTTEPFSFEVAKRDKVVSLPVLSWLKVPPERLYSTRDQDFGGDLWARPRTLNLVRQILSAHQADHLIFPLKVNDLSKMHAGLWLSSHPGGGHRRGREVDMWVPGFPNGKQYLDGARLGAEGANNLVRVLNALPDSVASNIEAVLVTTEGNTDFLEEVERMKNLGFKNTHLIKHYRGHINHFHVKFTEGGT